MLPVVAHVPAEVVPLEAETQEHEADDTQGVQLVMLAHDVAGHDEMKLVTLWPATDGVQCVVTVGQ